MRRTLVHICAAGTLVAALHTIPGAAVAGSKDPSAARAASAPAAKAKPAAARERTDGWPDTREGALGRRWVAAFSSGEEAMRRFYNEDLAEQSLSEKSIEGRLARYRDLREKFGRLTLGSVVKQSPGELTVTLLDSDAATHTFVFKAQTEAPHRLISVSMMQLQQSGHGGFHH